MGNPTYFLILFGLSLFSFILIKRYKLRLFNSYIHSVLYFSTIFLSGFIWDYYSVYQHIWHFPEGGTIGIKIGVLPIEELLFFIVAPFFGLTIYKFLETKTK